MSSATLLGDVSISYMLFDSLFTEKLSLNMSVGKLCWLKAWLFAPVFVSTNVLLLSGVDNTASEWSSFCWTGCKTHNVLCDYTTSSSLLYEKNWFVHQRKNNQFDLFEGSFLRFIIDSYQTITELCPLVNYYFSSRRTLDDIKIITANEHLIKQHAIIFYDCTQTKMVNIM